MQEPAAELTVIRTAAPAALVLHSTRRELLEHLASPDSAAGLARRLGLPRQRLNYHLRALEREGLVECIERRRKGNCTERILRATAKSFVISPEALGTLGPTAETARDRFSSTYLLASAAQTLRDVSTLDARARTEGKRLSTMTLEVEIRFASAGARAAFAEELTATLAALAGRYHDEHSPGGRRFRLATHLHPSVGTPSRPSARPSHLPGRGRSARRRQ